ncbi:MAG: HAD hydrolase family protein [Patescibacteria group bacterium]
MNKFIYFDVDGTLIHPGTDLTDNTKYFLKKFSSVEYGICTNRPLIDLESLDFLSETKRYICEGGVVSYLQDKSIYKVHPLGVNIDHERVKLLVLSFLKDNDLEVVFEQNKSRIYTSTITMEKQSLTFLEKLGTHVIDLYPLPNYQQVILGDSKIAFTVKGISKEYMIERIAEKDCHYFLISDDEPESGSLVKDLISYVSVEPMSFKFNDRCIYISKVPLGDRICDAISHIVNLEV